MNERCVCNGDIRGWGAHHSKYGCDGFPRKTLRGFLALAPVELLLSYTIAICAATWLVWLWSFIQRCP